MPPRADCEEFPARAILRTTGPPNDVRPSAKPNDHLKRPRCAAQRLESLLAAALLIAGQRLAYRDGAAYYVGVQACAGCHDDETQAWKQSHHARAMQAATPATALRRGENFVPAMVSLADLDQTRGMDEQGAAVLRKAIAVEPNKAGARHALDSGNEQIGKSLRQLCGADGR